MYGELAYAALADTEAAGFLYRGDSSVFYAVDCCGQKSSSKIHTLAKKRE